MNKIVIYDGVVEITFIHAQQPKKNKWVKMPSNELERIVDQYLKATKQKQIYSYVDGKETISIPS